MIAKLKGLVDTTGDNWMILDVQGVGYQLFCSRQTLGQLPPKSEATTMHVETVMRSEQLVLYGFATDAEKEYFKLLTTVQGVGGKMALAILSVAQPNALTQSILAQEEKFLTQADGVGPKLASRIVRELKDKVGKLALGEVSLSSMPAAAPTGDGVQQEALSALTNLGYKRMEALQAIASVCTELGDPSLQIVIAESLKKLSAFGKENGHG